MKKYDNKESRLENLSNPLFICKKADIRRKPISQCLFDDFWQEGELCILFSDTNLGKSLLAVQISDSLSKGAPVPHFKLNGGKRKVLYVDFKLSNKQFTARYSNNFTAHYLFHDNFLRTELQSDYPFLAQNEFDTNLFDHLEEIIQTTKAEVLVLDNITHLYNAKAHVVTLMETLQQLKKRYNLSIRTYAIIAKNLPLFFSHQSIEIAIAGHFNILLI